MLVSFCISKVTSIAVMLSHRNLQNSSRKGRIKGVRQEKSPCRARNVSARKRLRGLEQPARGPLSLIPLGRERDAPCGTSLYLAAHFAHIFGNGFTSPCGTNLNVDS